MNFDKVKAVIELNKNARTMEAVRRFGMGRCAQYVRAAIDTGFGIENTLYYPKKSILAVKGVVPMSANKYGNNLIGLGFNLIKKEILNKDYSRFILSDYTPLNGDISVIINSSSKYGHMCMFNGSSWVSDFTQNDICGGSKYRTKDTIINVYRYNA